MRILHLSDIHYGRRDATHSAHYFADKMGTPLPAALLEVLRPVLADGKPDAVIVSGDIGWSGSDDDYGFAFAFLDAIRTELAVPVVLAPGNHDVDWKAPDSPSRQDHYAAFLKRFYGDDFSTLYPRFDGADPKRRHRLSSLHRLLDRRLTILTVNSAATEGPSPEKCGMCGNAKHALPPIVVAPDTLKNWEAELQTQTDDFRVLVVHHHLLPFKEGPFDDTYDPDEPSERLDREIIANSARLQAWLASNHFSLVLHGHKHRVHVRHDLLLARHDDATRDIMVLGAGSAGVYNAERGNEDPLMFNTVEAFPLRDGVFSVAVDTYRIHTPDISPRAALDSPRITREVGKRRLSAPLVFHGRGVPECYEAISASGRKLGQNELIKNFTSIVDNGAFVLPKDAKLRGAPVTEAVIKKSFMTLHPEYDPNDGWAEPEKVRARLAGQPQRFRFQHGNRLFSMPASITPQGPLLYVDPLDSAIKAIPSSRAFVGLYNAYLDAREADGGDRAPPPCLVGIQFYREGNVLHLIAMFRKLELSFWWLVNMYEMQEVLKHACSKFRDDRPSLGSITFHASLAEWKGKDPGPAFAAAIDEIAPAQVVELALQLTRGETTGLKELLAEKQAVTNEDNIDERGLVLLSDTLAPFLKNAPGELDANLVRELRLAAEHLAAAREAARQESGAPMQQKEVVRGKEALERALALV